MVYKQPRSQGLFPGFGTRPRTQAREKSLRLGLWAVLVRKRVCFTLWLGIGYFVTRNYFFRINIDKSVAKWKPFILEVWNRVKKIGDFKVRAAELEHTNFLTFSLLPLCSSLTWPRWTSLDQKQFCWNENIKYTGQSEMLHYDMARERINTHHTCCGTGGKEVRKKMFGWSPVKDLTRVTEKGSLKDLSNGILRYFSYEQNHVSLKW